MRGSKDVKTPVDQVPMELPLDQKNISLKDEIMQQLRVQIMMQKEDKEIESIEEFWDVGDESDDFDPVLQSNYEIEDMQEEFLVPEALDKAASPPEPVAPASPADTADEQDTSEPPLAAQGG